MKTFRVTLQSKEAVAEGTMAFHFSKPQGYEFIAGQAADWALAEATEAETLNEVQHTFSIVSAPHEDELVIATRLRESRYKQCLNALAVGDQVWVSEPFGTLTLAELQGRAAVFMAGGIGITPFISMLRDAAKQGRQQPLRLFYSNRRPEDAAYLAELQQLAQCYPPFKLIATMTQVHKSAQRWSGATGYLNAQCIQEHCHDLVQPLYYVSGPPMLVETLLDLLIDEVGIDEDDIRSEGFTGY